MPVDYLGRLPPLLLVIMCGSLFKFTQKQIQAERLDTATALAGSIAHEMRNPLSRIKHSLEGMQRAMPSLTDQAQTLGTAQADALYRHMAESELAVKRGLQVIAMTMDEVSAKPIDTTEFDYLSAAETTDKALREYAFESDAERGKVSLHVLEDFTFRGDETAYLFVLFNLVKNALYYFILYPDARMTITIGQRQIKVHDSGPGVPPEVLAQLFQPFSSVGKSGGTGLGLAYCRRVMHAFGGEIDCASVPGEYTQFTLHFPPIDEQERETHRMAVVEKARAAFAGKRLLIVDDDAVQRKSTHQKLALLDAQLDQAEDGQRALEALARQHYDLVLLDLNMPVLDGYAVAEKIRQGQVPANRYVRIVAYTSELANLASVKTRKSGMDGFIGKPCAQLQLVQALHHALLQPSANAQSDAALAGRRVLLADDSPVNRKAVVAYLTYAGVMVTEAGHGQEVLEHLQTGARWDVILMDINMPGMNGLETAQAIRKGAACRDIPIVALTAHSDQGTVRAAHDAGMNDFIIKPVESTLLYEKLRQLVGGADKRAEAPAPSVTPSAAGVGGALLNMERLEGYRRIDMLQELLHEYIPEIARLVAHLEQSAARRDLDKSLDALHSLLGITGEAGASALYQAVRQAYVPMIEGRCWPEAEGWLDQIKALAAESEKALEALAPAPIAARAN